MFKYLLLLSAVHQTTFGAFLKRNNVCKSFVGYVNPDHNENCYYDPDTTLKTPQLIEKYAGVLETHAAVSEDGYVLTLFRIPRRNPKGVILLHHSIATYPHIYLWQGNNSLALRLWHEGFDVWLANQRGTTYSDKHLHLTKFQVKYWDFSFHEMGLYDVTAEIQLIRTMTNGSQVIFFGHSLGSAVGVTYASIKAEEARTYLKSMILSATPCYFDNAEGVVEVAKTISPLFKNLLESIFVGSPLLVLPILLPISKLILRLFPAILFITCILLWISCGYTPSETDPTFFNYDALIYGNNFSWKTLWHFMQLLTSKHRFQMYDYGEEDNLERYGTKEPPLYPIKAISVPTLLIASRNDSLINFKDSEALYEELEPEAKIDHWLLDDLNHLDYLLGLHRQHIFVDKLLMFLNGL